jgi:hypothetical protein
MAYVVMEADSFHAQLEYRCGFMRMGVKMAAS